ncbi:centromere protein U isoform X2 [Hippoglossus stenolepis]|uniref:centromere protein U isoform X2 n=1 Tax=Hippoglossus stenolepis TaxID=195615 RepID=UPI001FAF6D2F|nr:centromere protein U isoform X2 [Hippoglossus stenolepis]
MSATNGRRAKAPPESQKAASVDQAEPPNLSFIDKASFMEGLQLNDGNPLHSTAMEEDLNVLVEGQMDKGKAGRGDDHQMLKKKQRGAAVRREVTETGGEKRKISRRNPAEKFKARPEKGAKGEKKKGEPEPEVPATAESDTSVTPHTSTKPPPKANIRRQVIAKRRSAGKTSASRPLKKQQMKDMKRKNESDRGNSIDSESQESNTGQHSRSRVLSSDEEVDEGTYWKPSPKKARVFNLGKSRKSSPVRSQPRKSSSGSASAVADSSNTDKKKSKRRGRQATTDLEVVLDAFLDFCDEDRESVASKSVKQSIDSFSSNVKEQILEKVSTYKELRVLKRENAKVASLISTKTKRLLDAKHELMRAERQVTLLQKKEAELELRLDDLRRSRAFLHDIRDLNQHYLDYRQQHPKEQEMYGASSLPALLLERKHVQAAEHQLKTLNDQMEQRLKKSETCN